MSVPKKVGIVPDSDACEGEAVMNAERFPVSLRKPVRQQYDTIVAERDQASIEGSIEMGSEQ